MPKNKITPIDEFKEKNHFREIGANCINCKHCIITNWIEGSLCWFMLREAVKNDLPASKALVYEFNTCDWWEK